MVNVIGGSNQGWYDSCTYKTKYIEPMCTCGSGDSWLSYPHKNWCSRYGLPVLMHYRHPDGTIACGRNDAGSNCYWEHVTCRDCMLTVQSDVAIVVNNR